jgi:hypothetical protein
VDTLVDPVEMLSSSHMRAAAPAPPPRQSFSSFDPEAQVQWFARVMDDEPVTTPALDIEISWDEEPETTPTLVAWRAPH